MKKMSPAEKMWYYRMTELNLYRRFFVTKGGHQGLAPSSAAVGDYIAVFASGKMPFVIRRVDTNEEEEEHILTGTCYLDGKIIFTKSLDLYKY